MILSRCSLISIEVIRPRWVAAICIAILTGRTGFQSIGLLLLFFAIFIVVCEHLLPLLIVRRNPERMLEVLQASPDRVAEPCAYAKPGRCGPVHLGFADHYFDVQPGTLLERPPRHGDNLDAQAGVVPAKLRHRGGCDVGAEAVRCGHPDDAGDRVRDPAGLFEGQDGRFHPFGHLHGFRAQFRELPAARGTGQYPPAQGLLQRRYPARHSGVVQPQGLRRRRELRGSGDGQEHQQVIRVCIHICNSAHKGCWFDH